MNEGRDLVTVRRFPVVRVIILIVRVVIVRVVVGVVIPVVVGIVAVVVGSIVVVDLVVVDAVVCDVVALIVSDSRCGLVEEDLASGGNTACAQPDVARTAMTLPANVRSSLSPTFIVATLDSGGVMTLCGVVRISTSRQ